MVNIQIRGPLVHITVNQFAEHQMKDMINKKLKVDMIMELVNNVLDKV